MAIYLFFICSDTCYEIFLQIHKDPFHLLMKTTKAVANNNLRTPTFFTYSTSETNLVSFIHMVIRKLNVGSQFIKIDSLKI